MSGDRGQALVLSALLLAISAISIVGLLATSDRTRDLVRDERAGEAAAAAAGAVLADARFARETALGRDLERHEVAVIAADPAVAEAARAAAVRLAREHGRAEPTEVRVVAFGWELEVHVTLAGRTYVALVGEEP